MLEEVASRRQAHFSGLPPSRLMYHALPCSLYAGFHLHLPIIGTLHNLPPVECQTHRGAVGIKSIVANLDHLVLRGALLYPYALSRVHTPFAGKTVNGTSP
jgi:hypothetical protein